MIRSIPIFPNLRQALPVLLGLLAAGATTACDDFDDVTVPSVDSQKPLNLSAYYRNGKRTVSIRPLRLTTDDPEESILVLPAAYDAGGVKKLTVRRRVTRSCHMGAQFYDVAPIELSPLTRTQSGGVGDTVSNGLYAGYSFRAQNHIDEEFCNIGEWPMLTFHWSIESEDFHGNVAESGWNTLSYNPELW